MPARAPTSTTVAAGKRSLPSRSPPPVPAPEAARSKQAPRERSFLNDYIFSDAMPPSPPTLDPAAEPSWAAERREPMPPPEPKNQPPQQQQPPEEVAEGKMLAVEPAPRRVATQKASRKAEGKKTRITMVTPQPVRLGDSDILRKLDETSSWRPRPRMRCPRREVPSMHAPFASSLTSNSIEMARPPLSMGRS
ncbi:hypothetical protein C2845_PM13G25710 [Panicum miliaceum]|uniref:Uncharacterized protein n=1 Tax=Panicum miliaceum TaxID=4540 RepID=A0A3L6RJX7_PANMI|nr:hypothetical protein C2845_PM13G25710 [Panicum miliaceum]